jgi:hypothetical protein
MKEVYLPKNAAGVTYYIDTGFAWMPMYMQGELVWLRRYWVTWPERDGVPDEMYRTMFPYDPRRFGT